MMNTCNSIERRETFNAGEEDEIKTVRQINLNKVVPVSQMSGDDVEDTRMLCEMLERAIEFLKAHKWCGSIRRSFFGLGVGGVAAVFLFEIEPATKSADRFVWVIVGDLPPMYITIDDAPNPACALDAYIGAMEQWAEAAINGEISGDLVPVGTTPTKENGHALKKRLQFLDSQILRHYQDDLT